MHFRAHRVAGWPLAALKPLCIGGSRQPALAAWASVFQQLTPSNVQARKALASSIDKGASVFPALLVPLRPLRRDWAWAALFRC